MLFRQDGDVGPHVLMPVEVICYPETAAVVKEAMVRPESFSTGTGNAWVLTCHCGADPGVLLLPVTVCLLLKARTLNPYTGSRRITRLILLAARRARSLALRSLGWFAGERRPGLLRPSSKRRQFLTRRGQSRSGLATIFSGVRFGGVATQFPVRNSSGVWLVTRQLS